MRDIVGLHKSGHHASICVIRGSRIEIILKERVTRVKAAGGSVANQLIQFAPGSRRGLPHVSETSTFFRPFDYRSVKDPEKYCREFQKLDLLAFSARTNPSLRFVTHHLSHAMAAIEMSPYSRALIVVLDGAGNCPEAFESENPEIQAFPPPERRPDTKLIAEACTAYVQEGSRLRCVHKQWQRFVRMGNRRLASDGLGIFYETAADYIFNSNLAAGKVMGLAPFGRAKPVSAAGRIDFWRRKNWERAFRGKGRLSWEQSGDFQARADLAATVQRHFEESLFRLLRGLKKAHPDCENLILTGGCALNCVANMKVLESGLFKSVYIPPFPSDESAALGCASFIRYWELEQKWKPRGPRRQTACFGPLSSVPSEPEIRLAFADCEITRPRELARTVAELLANGAVVGWFQGRSESGPRALGNRSILASPLRPGIKDHLNLEVKMRESFRPYGGSCPRELVARYFDVPAGFESPFMSFAPKVRKRFARKLREITHCDGTSRIQTVRKEQDPLFHELLRHFGRLTGISCVLNTSMNGEGQPIVETVFDAARFFRKGRIDAMVVGRCLIFRTSRKSRPHAPGRS